MNRKRQAVHEASQTKQRIFTATRVKRAGAHQQSHKALRRATKVALAHDRSDVLVIHERMTRRSLGSSLEIPNVLVPQAARLPSPGDHHHRHHPSQGRPGFHDHQGVQCLPSQVCRLFG